MKDLSNIIREFDKFPYKSYETRRPTHDPTDSYFYLARHPAKCMMISDVLKPQNLPCENGNDWYETDYDLTRLFYGQEQIRRVTSGQNVFAALFYKRGKIKNNYRRWKFYEGKRIRMRP